MSSSQRNIITGHNEINMKIIIAESRLERLAINWLNDNYGDLEPFETKKATCCIYYLSNKNVVFEYNKKNRVFINYEISSFLKNYLSMDSQQIQELIKKWIKEYYNLKVKTVYESDEDFDYSEIVGDDTN
jgi:hypothetical protein